MPSYSCNPATVVLARFALVYIIASMYYIAASCRLGRPFLDSLTEEQKAIKRDQVKKRVNIFWTGCLVGITIIACWRPLVRESR